jgi:hypothetical protein
VRARRLRVALAARRILPHGRHVVDRVVEVIRVPVVRLATAAVAEAGVPRGAGAPGRAAPVLDEAPALVVDEAADLREAPRLPVLLDDAPHVVVAVQTLHRRVESRAGRAMLDGPPRVAVVVDAPRAGGEGRRVPGAQSVVAHGDRRAPDAQAREPARGVVPCPPARQESSAGVAAEEQGVRPPLRVVAVGAPHAARRRERGEARHRGRVPPDGVGVRRVQDDGRRGARGEAVRRVAPRHRVGVDASALGERPVERRRSSSRSGRGGWCTSAGCRPGRRRTAAPGRCPPSRSSSTRAH